MFLQNIVEDRVKWVFKGYFDINHAKYPLLSTSEMLVDLMGSQNDGVKLAAIKELLDRVESHPKDRIEPSKINFKDMEPGDRWEFISYEMQLALARNQYPDAKAAIIKKWLADGEPAVGNSSLADEQD